MHKWKDAPFAARTLLEVVNRARSPVKKSYLHPLPALSPLFFAYFPKSGPEIPTRLRRRAALFETRYPAVVRRDSPENAKWYK